MPTDPTPARDGDGESILVTVPFDDLAQDAFLDADGRRSVALSRCRACDLHMMGRRLVCSRCTSTDLDTVPLPEHGSLYSYTTVYASPFSSEPYTLGYIDFENGVRVMGHLRSDPASLGCDRPVRLVVDTDAWYFVTEEAGN